MFIGAAGKSFSSDSGGRANFALDGFAVVFSGKRFQESHQQSHFLLVQFIVTELVMVHFRNGFLQRLCGGVMHIRPGEFHVAEGRNAEAVPVRFLLEKFIRPLSSLVLARPAKKSPLRSAYSKDWPPMAGPVWQVWQPSFRKSL